MNRKDLVKMTEQYNLCLQWLFLRQHGVGLWKYFEEKNYKTVALYGANGLGERLLDELENTDIEVTCIIDRNADRIIVDGFDVFKPGEFSKTVDAIVVSPFFYFDKIRDDLKKNCNCDVISLKEIVNNLFAGII